MSIGLLAIYAKGSKAAEIRHHAYLHAVVPFIAATAYLAMYFGYGAITTAGVWTWYAWSCAAFVGVLYYCEAGACDQHGRGRADGGRPRQEPDLPDGGVVPYPNVFAIAPEGTKAATALTLAWAILVFDVIHAFVSATNIEKAVAVK